MIRLVQLSKGDIRTVALIEERHVRLFALAGQFEARLDAAQRQVDALTLSLLDRAWTPSPSAQSGCALSLREIRLAPSQRARLKGEL